MKQVTAETALGIAVVANIVILVIGLTLVNTGHLIAGCISVPMMFLVAFAFSRYLKWMDKQ